MPKVRLKILQTYQKWIIWVALHICKVRKADSSVLPQCKWWCPLPRCSVHAQGRSVPEGRPSSCTAAVFHSSLGTGAEFFLLSPAQCWEENWALFSKSACFLCQRHPAQAHSGLLVEKQLCQTPLDTFQGQHESGGSTDSHMEWGPGSLMGQSQVCRESARMPSLPSWGWEWQDVGCWGHPHGQLSSIGAQVLGPVGLLRCLGTGAPLRDAQVAPQEAGRLC